MKWLRYDLEHEYNEGERDKTATYCHPILRKVMKRWKDSVCMVEPICKDTSWLG